MTAEPTLEERIRATLDAEADGWPPAAGFCRSGPRGVPARREATFQPNVPFAAAGAAACSSLWRSWHRKWHRAPGRQRALRHSAGADAIEPTCGDPSDVASTYSDGLPRLDRRRACLPRRGGGHACGGDDGRDALPYRWPVRLVVSACVPASARPSRRARSCRECEATLLDGIPVIPNGLLAGARDGVSEFVVRVHVLDPRAVACAPLLRPRCEKAIVVEQVLWVGPVAQGDHRADRRRRARRALRRRPPAEHRRPNRPSRFGGHRVRGDRRRHSVLPRWRDGSRRASALQLPDRPAGYSDWRNACASPGFSDTAGTMDGAMYAAITFRFSSGQPPPVPPWSQCTSTIRGPPMHARSVHLRPDDGRGRRRLER